MTYLSKVTESSRRISPSNIMNFLRIKLYHRDKQIEYEPGKDIISLNFFQTSVRPKIMFDAMTRSNMLIPISRRLWIRKTDTPGRLLNFLQKKKFVRDGKKIFLNIG